MTSEQAMWFNHAIELALKEHHKGIGAIHALKKKVVCTVEHKGTTTRQECEVRE